MEHFKNIGKFLIALLCSFISPIGNIVKALLLLWLSNFFCGLMAGLLCNNESWNFKKAFKCCIELAIYVTIIGGLFWIGIYLNNKNEVEYAVKVVTWVIVYFYSSNILRNLILLFPGNQVFPFLNSLLSFEFMKHFHSSQKHKNNTP